MESVTTQPFIGCRTFNKDTSSYVKLPTPTDALLANLQLFHDVPCRIMDLIFAAISHPDFDLSQLTLRSSAEIKEAAEKARVRDWMAAAHTRSLNSEGVAVQAGLPQFVLEHVLDIIEAEKVARIKARMVNLLPFEDRRKGCFRAEEDAVLSDMSLVHRSWTLPAQKALGRSLYISIPNSRVDIPYNRSLIGPWTSLVAIDLYHEAEYEIEDYGSYADPDPDSFCLTSFANSDFIEEVSLDDQIMRKYSQWFEGVHNLLGCFGSLKCLLVRNYRAGFTEWANRMIRTLVSQNPRLEEVTLNALRDSFNFDPILENAGLLGNLRSLSMQAVTISDEVAQASPSLAQAHNLTSLCSVAIELSSFHKDFALLSVLATQLNVHLKSLTLEIYSPFLWECYVEELNDVLTPQQCTSMFSTLLSLRIHLDWLSWILPYCPGLQNLAVTISSDDTVNLQHLIPASIQDLEIIIKSALNAKNWACRLLELPTYSHFTALKWIRLKIVYTVSDRLVSDPDDQEKAVQGLAKKMESLCSDAGIAFQLDYTYC